MKIVEGVGDDVARVHALLEALGNALQTHRLAHRRRLARHSSVLSCAITRECFIS